jgi:hypothetical protein
MTATFEEFKQFVAKAKATDEDLKEVWDLILYHKNNGKIVMQPIRTQLTKRELLSGAKPLITNQSLASMTTQWYYKTIGRKLSLEEDRIRTLEEAERRDACNKRFKYRIEPFQPSTFIKCNCDMWWTDEVPTHTQGYTCVDVVDTATDETITTLYG